MAIGLQVITSVMIADPCNLGISTKTKCADLPHAQVYLYVYKHASVSQPIPCTILCHLRQSILERREVFVYVDKADALSLCVSTQLSWGPRMTQPNQSSRYH